MVNRDQCSPIFITTTGGVYDMNNASVSFARVKMLVLYETIDVCNML